MTTPSREQVLTWAREADAYSCSDEANALYGSRENAYNAHFAHLVRAAALEEAKDLSYELDGVIADVEHGAGFDAVCLQTVKRVRDAIAVLGKEEK